MWVLNEWDSDVCLITQTAVRDSTSTVEKSYLSSTDK